VTDEGLPARGWSDLRSLADGDRWPICYSAGMTAKTLALAIDKANALSEAAQEQIGRELLERIDALAELRAAIEVGIRELNAGKGEPLDIEDVKRKARAEHARG
jgi:hypothetical protein